MIFPETSSYLLFLLTIPNSTFLLEIVMLLSKEITGIGIKCESDNSNENCLDDWKGK